MKTREYFKGKPNAELLKEAELRTAELKIVNDEILEHQKQIRAKRKIRTKLQERLRTVTHWIR